MSLCTPNTLSSRLLRGAHVTAFFSSLGKYVFFALLRMVEPSLITRSTIREIKLATRREGLLNELIFGEVADHLHPSSDRRPEVHTHIPENERREVYRP